MKRNSVVIPDTIPALTITDIQEERGRVGMESDIVMGGTKCSWKREAREKRLTEGGGNVCVANICSTKKQNSMDEREEEESAFKS